MTPSGGTSTVPIRPASILMNCSTNNYNSGVAGLIRFYGCGDRIRFVQYHDLNGTDGMFDSSGTPEMIAALHAAASTWNASAFASGNYNMPLIETDIPSGPPHVIKIINVKRSSANFSESWCGRVWAANGGPNGDLGVNAPPTEIWLGQGGTDCGSLEEVAHHEIAHVLGILGTGSAGSDWHKRNPSILGHCAFAVTGTSQLLPQSMCPHITEIMYPMYGLVTRPVDDSRHIVTGILGNASLSIQETGTASAAPTALIAAGANISLCSPGASNDQLAETCPDPYQLTSGFSMSYSSDNTLVATVNASTGLVTAVAHGTATITRTVSSLPSTFQTSSLISGGSVAVTVTPQPRIAVITAGDGLTFGGGATVNPTPQVRVYAIDGVTPVGNVPVTFGGATGGSSLSGTSAVTNTLGYATVGSWTLGTAPGSYTMTASFPSTVSPNPVTFHATVSVPLPTAFTVDAPLCQATSKFVRYKLKWTPGGGATYEIRHGTTNDSSMAATTLMSSGPASTSSVYTPYYSRLTPPLTHYWWLRELNGSGTPTGSWMPNVANGQSAADGCVF